MAAIRDPKTGKFKANPNSKRTKKRAADAAPSRFSAVRLPQTSTLRGAAAKPAVSMPVTTGETPWLTTVDAVEAPPAPPVPTVDAVDGTGGGTAEAATVPPVEAATVPPVEAAPLEFFDPTPDNVATAVNTTSPPANSDPPPNGEVKVPVSPKDSGEMIAMMVNAVWGIYVSFRHPYVEKAPEEIKALFDISEKENKAIEKAGELYAKHANIQVSPEANLLLVIGKAVGPKIYQAEMLRPQLMAASAKP